MINRENSLRKGKHRNTFLSLWSERKGWILKHTYEGNCQCRPRPSTFPTGSMNVMKGSKMTPFSLSKKWGDPTSLSTLSTGTSHFLRLRKRYSLSVRGHPPPGFVSHPATPTFRTLPPTTVVSFPVCSPSSLSKYTHSFLCPKK